MKRHFGALDFYRFIAAFGVAALGFVLQTSLLSVQGPNPQLRWLQEHAHRVALVYLQMAALDIGLVWFAIVLG